MKLAYIAGPYRDDRGAWYIRQNIRKAEDVGIELLKMGYIPIVPHKLMGLWDGIVPDDIFLQCGLEILKRCDLIVMLPEWENSEGACIEKLFQFTIGLKIRIF